MCDAVQCCFVEPRLEALEAMRVSMGSNVDPIDQSAPSCCRAKWETLCLGCFAMPFAPCWSFAACLALWQTEPLWL